MSFNGSGTFLINTAGQPVVAGTVISSTAFNALTADLATGLSTAITKDGQTTVTANIPMSTYKFTGLGVGSAATDSANLSQVQSTVTKLLTSVSGTDTITAVGAPVVAAYAAGQMFYFVATGDNTGAVTLNIDSLGAKAVTRDGSVALAAGDIKSGEVVVVVYDGTRFQVVSQLNSAGDARFANVSIASSLYVGGVSTFVGNAGFSANVSIASALSVGGVAAITGATTIGGNLTLNGGTANGVLYLNGSKVATSGSGLTYNGSNLINTNGYVSTSGDFRINNATFSRVAIGDGGGGFVGGYNITYSGSPIYDSTGAISGVYYSSGGNVQFFAGGSASAGTAAPEAMRLTSTGLGIGTSSPTQRLEVSGDIQQQNANYLRGKLAAGTGTRLFGLNSANSLYVGGIDASQSEILFVRGGTTQMVIDSSGSLGLGVTPSAWQSGVKAFQNGAGALYTINTVQQRLSLNAYRDSAGTMRYINSSINAAEFRMGEGDGSFQFHTAPSGTAGTAISFTQAMTLDASGNLGVGITSPFADSGYRSVDIRGSTGGQINFGTTSTRYAQINIDSTNGMTLNTVTAAPLRFFINGAESARITSGGQFSVNTTSAGSQMNMFHNGATIAGFLIRNTDTGAATQNAILFERNTSIVGVITTTNTATAYVTSSDRRLKNNIAPADNAGSVIDAIEVVKHDWKVGGHTRYGMIAQDLHSVAPEAVFAGDDGEELEKAWGVDYSKLVPMLVKEIQSLRARVAQLETK